MVLQRAIHSIYIYIYIRIYIYMYRSSITILLVRACCFLDDDLLVYHRADGGVYCQSCLPFLDKTWWVLFVLYLISLLFTGDTVQHPAGTCFKFLFLFCFCVVLSLIPPSFYFKFLSSGVSRIFLQLCAWIVPCARRRFRSDADQPRLAL